jgi:hypothetical protein
MKFRPKGKQTGRSTQTLRLFTDEANHTHLDVLVSFLRRGWRCEPEKGRPHLFVEVSVRSVLEGGWVVQGA